MSAESAWEHWAEIATVIASVVALFSWNTARKSKQLADKSLEVAKEARDIAKKELEAKADNFEVKWLDSKRLEKDGLVALYIELINKSALPSALANFNVSAHMHFSDGSEQEIDIEEYLSEKLSSNMWKSESQLTFPLSFGERQVKKGYVVVRLPSLKTESDYVKKLTLTLVSSQNYLYKTDCYGL